MSVHSKKFQRKYMKLACAVADDNETCGSRHLGVVIASLDHEVCIGYNGPPAGTPHCDSEQFFRDYFWPSLTQDHKDSFRRTFGTENEEQTLTAVCDKWAGSGCCPRKLIGAGPGEQSELCSCQHAERNAVTNCTFKTKGCAMYCWCGLPCIQCAGTIINARISEVHCLKGPYYHWQSEVLFKHANVSIFEYEAVPLLD